MRLLRLAVSILRKYGLSIEAVSEILTFKASPVVRLLCTESIPFCLQALVDIVIVSIAKVPEVVIGPPVNPVPVFEPTEVTVPPELGELFVIVKFGYVPLIDIPVPAFRATV
jgi:hypothetical protein